MEFGSLRSARTIMWNRLRITRGKSFPSPSWSTARESCAWWNRERPKHWSFSD